MRWSAAQPPTIDSWDGAGNRSDVGSAVHGRLAGAKPCEGELLWEKQ